MVFEYGMGESSPSRTMRADNYALSEDAKRQRDLEQTNLTERAYAEALRLLTKHRALLDRVAHALLEKETLSRKELLEIFGDVEPESRASESVGVVRVLDADARRSSPRRASAARPGAARRRPRPRAPRGRTTRSSP